MTNHPIVKKMTKVLPEDSQYGLILVSPHHILLCVLH